MVKILIFQFILEHFSELLQFGLDHSLAIRLRSVICIIILKVILRFIKNFIGLYGSHYLSRICLLPVQFFDVVFGQFFLVLILVNYSGTVLVTYVVSLHIEFVRTVVNLTRFLSFNKLTT